MNLWHHQWPAIATVLAHADRSPFYRQKYGRTSPVAPEDFQNLPVLTRQELYENSYPKSLAMLSCPLEGMIVTSTGGSSGLARYTLLTHQEWLAFASVQAEAMKTLGITSRDVVANLLMAGSLWPSFIGVHDVIRIVGATHLPISANIDLDRIIRFCKEFQPTVLLSLPTLFVFLADKALQEGLRFPRLRMIAYAGEHMSKEAREHIGRALGISTIKALAYTSADAGLMGYQCAHCAAGTYHLPRDFQCIETVDPETLAPCSPEQPGEILVTNLARFSMPIIRYRIGDLATMHGSLCPCGDPNPLFSLQGRAGEDFKLGGGYISMGVVEAAVANYCGGLGTISLNHLLELEDRGNQMEVRLYVEAGDPEQAKAQASSLAAALCTAIPEVQVGLDKRYIRELAVTFVPLGSLERSPITGKVKRLNDKRVQE
ncbi:phenylacetate--CoA ligase family protein [Desulfofustis limnaeus]|jgi:phenylacetate-CoA ligase|uniref:Phenylacetate-coenzyme A ligase n=1 Tax=Desulfofustis limnaeus TaxID=2740163 RepID=A0ABN6M5E3_9BACT|nr:AMP-binding protein [Desulfofustis limnaeus]MDX9896057.1 AMP-binding protein [Desulfofustis sp.]BDD88091.1 phenylacetate-coenzyme A ligase [Desulfofustis limnaeus]